MVDGHDQVPGKKHSKYMSATNRLLLLSSKFRVTLKQHIKDSIPLPLATMERLNRLVTVR